MNKEARKGIKEIKKETIKMKKVINRGIDLNEL